MTFEKITAKSPSACKNQVTVYFYRRIAQQKQVLQTIQALLPDELAQQVHYCVVKESKLLIYTDSAIWASQLRFYQAVMLAAITSVTSVQIKIIVQPVNVIEPPKRKARLPSPEKIAQLQQDSLNIADESLRLSLLKLSETLARLAK